MMKKISYSIIVVGVMLLLFPVVQGYYYDWKEKRLLQTYESEPAKSDLEIEYERLSYLFEEEDRLLAAVETSHATDVHAPSSASAAPATPTPSQPSEDRPKDQEQAIAIISIDKINLKLPILAGATQKNLRYAAAHMTQTASLGETGNAAVAAHRGRSKGRLFNRLDELDNGDIVTIEMKDKRVQYEVYDKLRVDPTDISVLSDNGQDAILTLITCDPVMNPTHRLIIHAKMI